MRSAIHKNLDQFFTIETDILLPPKINIFDLLNEHDLMLQEGDILFITTKILSLHQGRCVLNNGGNKSKEEKDRLSIRESSYFLPRDITLKYPSLLTITENCLISSAGIDESNANGYFILWPKNIDNLLMEIRNFLIKKYNITKLGLIATDTRTNILQIGTSGIAVACCGFNPIYSYMGNKDLFGRNFQSTEVNIAQSLSVMAVLLMGEGTETTPIALYRPDNKNSHKYDNDNISQKDNNIYQSQKSRSFKIEYLDRATTELMTIKPEEDLFYPLLKNFVKNK